MRKEMQTQNLAYDKVKKELSDKPRKWLITGVAGFIGSNLLEALLLLDQRVVGVDNFSTGLKSNLLDKKINIPINKWKNFEFIEGDISNINDCNRAMFEIDIVLHQAALGSVPRSIEDPIATNNANINGFLNIIWASKKNKVSRFVYAASSSTYGDHPSLPKVENLIGKPLSPYAVTKYVNELYAEVFSGIYGIETIGLRYFNVFGRNQNPNSQYSAVIPKWIWGILNDEEISVYGDGETSRDFCYIENVIQANILAALTTEKEAINKVYNIAVGERTTLNALYSIIKNELNKALQKEINSELIYKNFREGDVRHSEANINLARGFLNYNPSHTVKMGLTESMEWYIKKWNGER